MKLRRVEAQVRLQEPSSLEKKVIPPIHDCLAAAWAPLVPLLTHAARTLASAEFSAAVEKQAGGGGGGLPIPLLF